MEQVFVGLIVGAVDKRVLMAVRAAVDFIYFASLHSHTSGTLAALSQALDDFHKYKEVFVELEVRDHFNIPKIHAMEHYVHLIGLFGSADSFNTESPERLHIDYAKDAYRASNKRDYIAQMTTWLRRQEAVDRLPITCIGVEMKPTSQSVLQMTRMISMVMPVVLETQELLTIVFPCPPNLSGPKVRFKLLTPTHLTSPAFPLKRSSTGIMRRVFSRR